MTSAVNAIPECARGGDGAPSALETPPDAVAGPRAELAQRARANAPDLAAAAEASSGQRW